MRIKSLRRKAAFTLIELMVVLVVLGGLMTILLVSLQDSGITEDQARLEMVSKKARVEVGLLKFQSRFGRYPTTSEGLEALVEPPPGIDASNYPANGFVARKYILDPWQNVFVYENTGGSYELKTLGADGQEGGEGANADRSLSDITP